MLEYDKIVLVIKILLWKILHFTSKWIEQFVEETEKLTFVWRRVFHGEGGDPKFCLSGGGCGEGRGWVLCYVFTNIFLIF